jgi:hypothetical protein
MTPTEKARETLTDELEALLDDVAPAEADAAALYVADPAAYAGKPREELAGAPGGGVVSLLGPLVLPWLAHVAALFLKELQREGIAAVTDAAIDWVKGLFGKGKAAPTSGPTTRADTVRAITVALIDAGWKADAAGAIAEQVWARGEKAGRRMARSDPALNATRGP